MIKYPVILTHFYLVLFLSLFELYPILLFVLIDSYSALQAGQ